MTYLTGAEERDPFARFVGEMSEIRHSKRKDYAGEDFHIWMANFVLSALLSGQSVLGSFRALQGTKVARLVSLDQQEREPNNESVHDTHVDLANYTALLEAFIMDWGAEATRRPLIWKDVLPYVMAYLVGYPVPSMEELRQGQEAVHEPESSDTLEENELDDEWQVVEDFRAERAQERAEFWKAQAIAQAELKDEYQQRLYSAISPDENLEPLPDVLMDLHLERVAELGELPNANYDFPPDYWRYKAAKNRQKYADEKQERERVEKELEEAVENLRRLETEYYDLSLVWANDRQDTEWEALRIARKNTQDALARVMGGN